MQQNIASVGYWLIQPSTGPKEVFPHVGSIIQLVDKSDGTSTEWKLVFSSQEVCT